MRGIVGTAGHIDHGKTALIGALTGEDTDRLPEERQRGISIDLGFSHLETEAGTLGVIDVPGHEDFIRNMLAGATGIDVLLLVVAADEGVMPQTREHVAIAGLLGVHRAVVALTKADLVDEDWLGLAYDDVAEFLAGTPFEDAPIIATSATEGSGVDQLRAAIVDAFDGTRGQVDDLFRLPVDRTFTVRGTGTVVTGTVWSGRLSTDAAVRLLPGGREARVRGLQVHGRDVDAVEAGERAAVALAGIDREDAPRGTTVVADPAWRETTRITTSLRVLRDTRWSIEPWQRVRVHIGTAEVMARAVPLDGETVAPGGQGLVQLRLEAPLVARAGDRFVVRSYSPVTTIGGGVVLEPLAGKRAGLEPVDVERFAALLDSDPAVRVGAALAAAGEGGAMEARLHVTSGASPSAVEAALDALGAVRAGGRVFDPDAAAGVRDRVVEAVDRHHMSMPTRPGIDPAALRTEAGGDADEALVEHVLDRLLADGRLVSRRGMIARPDFEVSLSPEEQALRDRVRRRIAEAGLAPPRLDELVAGLGGPVAVLQDIVALLEADGILVRVEHDLYADADVLGRAADRVREALGGRAGLSPGDFRDVLDISRRHLIPLLEYFDRSGLTQRTSDGRAVPE